MFYYQAYYRHIRRFVNINNLYLMICNLMICAFVQLIQLCKMAKTTK